jgi:hypothetical protein
MTPLSSRLLLVALIFAATAALRLLSSRLLRSVCVSTTAAVALGWGQWGQWGPVGLTPEHVWQPVSCVADSTGKMSSKLTAKKRYLPRVIAGVSAFNDVKTFGGLLNFEVNEFPSMKRALGLYGASLRKGEVYLLEVT